MNGEIFKWYDSFLKMCKVLELLGCSYQFEEPATEEITECEQKKGFTLPSDYKEWLKLTRCVRMEKFDFNIYMPNEVWGSEDGCKIITIGDTAAFAREYFY